MTKKTKLDRDSDEVIGRAALLLLAKQSVEDIILCLKYQGFWKRYNDESTDASVYE